MVRPASPPPAPPPISSRSQLPAAHPERHTTNGDENTDPMAREEHLERTPGEPVSHIFYTCECYLCIMYLKVFSITSVCKW